jgi:hypothetical protein
MRSFCRPPVFPASKLAPAALLASLLVAPLASAQGVYRIVGPDGKVTYSDQPPPAATSARPVGAAASAAGAAAPTLPAEVRQAVGRPVPRDPLHRLGLHPLRQRSQLPQRPGHSFCGKNRQQQRRPGRLQAPEWGQQPASADRRRTATQGLFGHRMGPVPGCSRLPEEVSAASQLPPRGSHPAGRGQIRCGARSQNARRPTRGRNTRRSPSDAAGQQSQRHPLLRNRGPSRPPVPRIRMSACAPRLGCPAGTRWPSGGQTPPRSPHPATG